jgi:oligopeptide/dipeptide ABC transporter ATP-binding protein
MPEPLLRIEHLTTAFAVDGRQVPAVNDVSLTIFKGETVGLVGESGSGKSMTAYSIMRLVPPPGRITGGAIWLNDRNLLSLTESEMRKIRGAEISLIFQEPMTALNPVFTVGSQIAEALIVHGRASRREARDRALELLKAVSVPEPVRRLREYPHQLSGGLRQRVLIAIALACQPALVIADEPTTALDVTIQAQILELLKDLQRRLGLSLLLITHDLGVVAQTADRVAVMYAGRIVETGPVREIMRAPRHPYTRGLLDSIPGVSPGARLKAIDGAVPTLDALPPGCAFAPRCQHRFARCDEAVPALTAVADGHEIRCFLVEADAGAEAVAAAGPHPGGAR